MAKYRTKRRKDLPESSIFDEVIERLSERLSPDNMVRYVIDQGYSYQIYCIDDDPDIGPEDESSIQWYLAFTEDGSIVGLSTNYHATKMQADSYLEYCIANAVELDDDDGDLSPERTLN